MSVTEWHPPVRDPIRDRTSNESNDRIDRMTLGALDDIPASPAAIRLRLQELDREWTVDRALMLNFAVAGAAAGALALRSLRRSGRLGLGGLLLRAQLGFLAYHAIRRWCPPLPFLRRLGFRSDQEISAERVALSKRLLLLGYR